MTESETTQINQVNVKQVVREALDTANGGNIKVAITKLKSWINNNDEDIDEDRVCRYYLGLMYDKSGSVEEAIEMWNNGITNNPPYNHSAFKSMVDTLSIFANNITICTLIAEFSVPNSADYDFHVAIAGRRAKQAQDGPGVSYSYGQVCYSANKLSEEETQEWTSKRVSDATLHYQAALLLNGDNPNLYAKFARFLEWNKQYKKAVNIWDDLSEEYSQAITCWVGKARCLYHLEEYKKCQNILENVAIKIDPRESEIYTILQSVAEKLTLSDEYVQELKNKSKFYSTMPEWLNMTFTQEVWGKFAKLYNIKPDKKDEETDDENDNENDGKNDDENDGKTDDESADEPKENYIETLVNKDLSLTSTKLLISYVNGHYNHGVESMIFNCLIDRMKNQKQDLLSYIRAMLNAGSVCVIKGAANALAELKDHESVDILCKLLPQDTRAFWCMNIADALGILQDYRAIPALAKTVSYGFDSDSASGDGAMMMMVDHAGNQQRCATALGMFTDMTRNEMAIKILKTGCNVAPKQDLKICCLVSLFRIYSTNISGDDKDVNGYKKEFDGLFAQILGYLNSIKGHDVPYVVKYVLYGPLKDIKETAMKNNIEYVVGKCEQLFNIIEQEEKDEKIREEQKRLKEEENKKKEQEVNLEETQNDENQTESQTD